MSLLELSETDRIPLEAIDVGDPLLHHRDVAKEYFARLRREDPVHYCADSPHGPYWSITKFHDIMRVDSNHAQFSSAGSVVIDDDFFSGEHFENEAQMSNFIIMDPPLHTEHRNAVSPALAPGNIRQWESDIRERARRVLDELPVGETFDWVTEVSIELTIQLLATLLDFPFEERHKLLDWSHFVAGIPGDGVVQSWEQRSQMLAECGGRFLQMRSERAGISGRVDLISVLANTPVGRAMSPLEFVSTILLLMVGGNDTTRNAMSGSILAMHEHPAEFARVKQDPGLIASMVPEILRWQSPVVSMRRTATEDSVVGGKTIGKGDKVMMWYLSGNRDEEVFDRPDDFVIDRPNPRQHLAFGFGIHRCVGNRLAELQLRVLWEEMLPRFERIEVVGPPGRIHSTLLRGYTSLPVRLYR